ncbi:MAG: type toxin-antitoxin system HicB family antitoxin [Actinomycetia bacterium]|nr:type toxin-antitoxin system HicB family antitoxin [Actinomycetes bacterium]
MSTLHLTAQIWPEDDAFIAHCPELEVTSQGDTFEHAIAMIKEAVELTLSDMSPEELADQLHPTPALVPFEVQLSA